MLAQFHASLYHSLYDFTVSFTVLVIHLGSLLPYPTTTHWSKRPNIAIANVQHPLNLLLLFIPSKQVFLWHKCKSILYAHMARIVFLTTSNALPGTNHLATEVHEKHLNMEHEWHARKQDVPLLPSLNTRCNLQIYQMHNQSRC